LGFSAIEIVRSCFNVAQIIVLRRSADVNARFIRVPLLITVLGMLRLQSFYQRIHGPAITITLGAGCILLASMVYFSITQARLVIHEVLMTAPVVSMLIMRAAVCRDLCANRAHIAGRDAEDV
jgi:multicomponent K+:H+ antiporter subunit G